MTKAVIFDNIDQSHIEWCCGVDVVGNFDIREEFNPTRPWVWSEGVQKRPSWWTAEDTKITIEDYKYHISKQSSVASINRSGTGLLVATFNDEQKRELAAYKKMVTVLYESTWRPNTNSGNKVKLVVGQYKEPAKKPTKK